MRLSSTCKTRRAVRVVRPCTKGPHALLYLDEKRGRHSRYPLLSVESARIGYGADGEADPVVEDVSFEVWAGEKVMLLGPLGCGKSTMIKAIAGFMRPQGGAISFAGREDLRPGPDRAVVFQASEQLFAWRTVMDNVAFPLRLMGRSREEAEETAGWSRRQLRKLLDVDAHERRGH